MGVAHDILADVQIRSSPCQGFGYFTIRAARNRELLAIVEAHQACGRDIEVVHYLDTPPDADTIRMLISTFDGPSRPRAPRPAVGRDGHHIGATR